MDSLTIAVRKQLDHVLLEKMVGDRDGVGLPREIGGADKSIARSIHLLQARKEREEAEAARKMEAIEAATQAAAENKRRLAILEKERLDAQRAKEEEEEEKKKAKVLAEDKKKGENKAAEVRRRGREAEVSKAAEANRKVDDEEENDKKMTQVVEGIPMPEEKKQQVLTFEWVT